MARTQGSADLYLKGRQILAATVCGAEGGRTDEDGVWRGLTFLDLDRHAELVDVGAPDEALGRAARMALQASVFGVPAPSAWATGIDSDKSAQNAKLAAAFGSSDARLRLSSVRCCVVDHIGAELRLAPTRRRRGGYFDALSPEGRSPLDIALRADSPDAEFGAAIRRCFERCL